MAKGSAMGLWRGKKGSSVFYSIYNSNSLQRQGIRERNYEPANPQTYRQAGQRMRMKPAQAVYGALKSTIERSWQGVKYGQLTRQAFLALALRVDKVPAIARNSYEPVPAEYQIAKGSLTEIVNINIADHASNYPIGCTQALLPTATIADVSVELLANNAWLQEGDQLSFVVCTSESDGKGFIWTTRSFFINSNESELTLGDVLHVGEDFPTSLVSSISFTATGRISITTTENVTLYATAVVVSREGSTPMRSNATLAVNYTSDVLTRIYSEDATEIARRSYMKPIRRADTDWPVDPEGEGGEGEITPTTYNYSVSQVTTTFDGDELEPTSGGSTTGAGEYELGDNVTLRATANSGYTFDGWYRTKEDAIAGRNSITDEETYSFEAGSAQFSRNQRFWAHFIRS